MIRSRKVKDIVWFVERRGPGNLYDKGDGCVNRK